MYSLIKCLPAALVQIIMKDVFRKFFTITTHDEWPKSSCPTGKMLYVIWHGCINFVYCRLLDLMFLWNKSHKVSVKCWITYHITACFDEPWFMKSKFVESTCSQLPERGILESSGLGDGILSSICTLWRHLSGFDVLIVSSYHSQLWWAPCCVSLLVDNFYSIGKGCSIIFLNAYQLFVKGKCAWTNLADSWIWFDEGLFFVFFFIDLIVSHQLIVWSMCVLCWHQGCCEMVLSDTYHSQLWWQHGLRNHQYMLDRNRS